MGSSLGKPYVKIGEIQPTTFRNSKNKGPIVNGEWKSSFTTGYKYVTPNITSGSNIQKKKGSFGTEVWGPYKKQYTKSLFGADQFTPPEKVDGIPILCRCSLIKDYMRSKDGSKNLYLGAQSALLFGSNRPACWEDSESIMNYKGSNSFNVIIGHPDFYTYAASKTGIVGILKSIAGFKGGKGKTLRKARTKRSKTLRKK